MDDFDEISEAIHFSSFGSSSTSDQGSFQAPPLLLKHVFEAVKEGREEQTEHTEKVLNAIADAVTVVGRDKAAPQIAEILKTLKEGQEEQKRQHDKLHYTIVGTILGVGFGLGVLMFVCTVMLYMKPCACAPVVNHTTCAPPSIKRAPPVYRLQRAPVVKCTKCAPCAPVVKCTKCAPPVYRIKRAPVVNSTTCAPCAQPVNHTTTVNIIVHVHVNGMNSTSFMDTPNDQCTIDDKEMWEFTHWESLRTYKKDMQLMSMGFLGSVLTGISGATALVGTVATGVGVI